MAKARIELRFKLNFALLIYFVFFVKVLPVYKMLMHFNALERINWHIMLWTGF